MRNFSSRSHVNFMLVNEIEVMYRRSVHDPKWSPTPNDPQIFSLATWNDPLGIIGMEWDDA